MSRTDETKPRYYVEKRQQKGTLFYWQPSKSLLRAGFKTVPLSRDRAEAIKQAEALNAKVDAWRGGLPVQAKNTHGTLPWIIEQFERSPTWAKLAPSTQKTYRSQFRAIKKWSRERGDPAMRLITRSDAEALWASLKDARGPAEAAQVIARCTQLWHYAVFLEEDIVSRNPFSRMDLPKLPSRSQVWQPGQVAALIETGVARTMGQAEDWPRGQDQPERASDIDRAGHDPRDQHGAAAM